MACHKKCEKLTGNLCGLNQKLVAEALQALKRGESMFRIPSLSGIKKSAAPNRFVFQVYLQTNEYSYYGLKFSRMTQKTTSAISRERTRIREISHIVSSR